MATTKTTKAVNYTPEQEARLSAGYTGGMTPEELASEMGKTARSVVAKLSRMGIYKKKEYVSKTGEKPVKKDEQADKLAALVGLTEADADSLTKANKTALGKILAVLEAALADKDQAPDGWGSVDTSVED